jgi:hypothetical protein
MALAIPCEVYSRVVGYLRPTTDWNVGKQEEFKNRGSYDKVFSHPDIVRGGNLK